MQFEAKDSVIVLYLVLSLELVSSELSFIFLVDDKTDAITSAVNDAVQNTFSTDKTLNCPSILQTKV